MTQPPVVLVHPDAAGLAAAAADRLATRIAEAQAATGSASVVLTGGGVGIATLRALREAAGRAGVDWRSLDLWWGDERFLPMGHPDRNDTQAKDALLDQVDVDWARVHRMPGPDGPDGDDPDAAAERYAAELAAAAKPDDTTGVPAFDVLLLGVGPEGHVASIFPESPAAVDQRAVVAVRNSPKPPPTRLSLTFGTLNSAREAWLLAAGAEKAPAVQLALAGTPAQQLPAAGIAGRAGTWWFVDEAAASQLPPGLGRRATG
ncbi:MAG: 6-phosphogluconolactonase [Frankiales bacterium]|jgi:6-phosphogluconolactonase|nr:6-phosphogluconolactonase [Frankiales bacterium]MDX6213672.1 6-phosphogluconolactonase [Frankiales bacterium]